METYLLRTHIYPRYFIKSELVKNYQGWCFSMNVIPYGRYIYQKKFVRRGVRAKKIYQKKWRSPTLAANTLEEAEAPCPGPPQTESKHIPDAARGRTSGRAIAWKCPWKKRAYDLLKKKMKYSQHFPLHLFSTGPYVTPSTPSSGHSGIPVICPDLVETVLILACCPKSRIWRRSVPILSNCPDLRI